jgi:peptidyl-prolyl cis-trans isomerase SurA
MPDRSLAEYILPLIVTELPVRSINMNLVRLRPLIAFLFAALLSTPAWVGAQTRDLSNNGVLLDRIAAVVNDGVILDSQLEEQVTEITERLRQQQTELPPPNVLRKQVLERLVMEEVQLQRAQRLGVQVSDEMLNGAVADVAKRNKINFADLPQTLAAQGIDYRTFRDEIRKQMTIQLLQQRDVIAHINIAPRELDQFMAKQQNAPDANAEYNVSHILVSVAVSATPEQLDARTTRAREVYEKAKSGEDFAQLAVTYSDSSTNIEGGALGWRRGSQLPSIAADQIAKMKPGDVSEPVRTPSGFHIFKLNEVRGGVQQTVESQVHARHILLKTSELQDDQTAENKLASIRERILKGEDFATIAAATSQDPGSAAEGGDLGWAGPSTFVPDFEKHLESLQVNEISQPFKSPYGWHIVQVLGRRQYDATDDVRRQRAFAELRQSKAEEEIELWLRRLRDEAFVDYRL